MASFGEELRRERELRQISLREVAEATKINLRYLQAMEGNDFADLPGGVFNRGFVRAYCQFIGVDPEAMVNAYLLEEQAQGLDPTGASRGLLRGSRGSSRPKGSESVGRASRRGSLLIWLAAVFAALGIAAALLVYLELVRRGSIAPRRPAAPVRPRVAIVTHNLGTPAAITTESQS